MLKFNINLKGLDKGEKVTKDKSKRVLMKAMFKMEEIAIQNAPVDRGFLKQNITLFPQILAEKYVLTSRAPYSAAMEYGTKPFYAPIDPLEGWAKRVLGDESAAYAIRAKIAKVGIRAQPFMRPALHQVQNFWLDQYKKEEFQ